MCHRCTRRDREHEPVELGRAVGRQVQVRLRPVAKRDRDVPDVVLGDRVPGLTAEPAIDLCDPQLREAVAGIGGGKAAELAADVGSRRHPGLPSPAGVRRSR